MKQFCILAATAVAVVFASGESVEAQRYHHPGAHRHHHHHGGRYYAAPRSSSAFSIGISNGNAGFFYSTGYPRYSGRGYAPLPGYGFGYRSYPVYPRPIYGGGIYYGGGCRRW